MSIGGTCQGGIAALWWREIGWPTPVKAVPASSQAKGSRYQGDTEMRYSEPATAPRVRMAPHQALP